MEIKQYQPHYQRLGKLGAHALSLPESTAHTLDQHYRALPLEGAVNGFVASKLMLVRREICLRDQRPE